MCGIAAIFNYATTEKLDKAELICLRDSMSDRGPDGSGVWFDNHCQVGLAHRRLAIIDLSENGAQPMASSDGMLRITFNGEIYNYLALRQTLESKGYLFHSQSDTEVLLYLYKEYGEQMVDFLRGMFAFVIWDECKQGILIVRDHFGIKPLYYADNGKTIRIASQVRSLVYASSSHIDTSAQPAGQVGFYLWGSVPEPYTIYKGIYALPAGTIMWVDAKGASSPRKFFNITSELQSSSTFTTTSLNKNELSHILEEAMLDTVKHHLISDVPVGVFLSSGLDSATLLSLAAQIMPNQLKTFTLGFKEFSGTQNDETVIASELARYYGARHKTQMVRKEDFFDDIEHLYSVMDQPSIDGVNSYFVCKGAHASGIKVALSGLGGDELFAGYPTFTELPRLVRSLSVFNHFPGLGRGLRYISAPLLKHLTSPKYAGLFEYGSTLEGAYLLRRGLFMPWELPDFLDVDLVRQGWHDLQTLSHLEDTTHGINSQRLQITALETSWYMKNQLLRDNDWASMANSLELRVPLVDINLFRTVRTLINSGLSCSKHDMALTPKKRLPNSILYRKKTGFSIPVKEWILNEQTLSNNRTRGLRAWAIKVFNKKV